MKYLRPKTLLLSLIFISVFAEAEMSAEEHATMNKEVVSTKKAIPKETNAGGMTAEEHEIMLKEEAKTKTKTKMTPEEHAVILKEEEAAKNTPEKVLERKNRRVIEQLFNVTTVKVKALTSAKEQVNYGFITAVESRKVDVVAWFSGFVEILYANTLYKRVEAGDALVKIYSPEVYKAKQDYLNSIKFNAKRSSPGMLRGAKAKLRLLNVCAREIEAIEKKGIVEEYTTIYAPISGWVFMKNLNEGSSVKKQAKLFEIVNLDKVWLEAKIFQKELSHVDNLENFSVTVQSSSEKFKAKVDELYPFIDPKEATATLRFVVDNREDLLIPGMYAKVHSSTAKKHYLVVPRTAVLRKDGKWYAFLATDFKGEYEPVQIDVEPLDKHQYIVKNGLSEGESIVNNALFMMDSDAQINSIY